MCVDSTLSHEPRHEFRPSLRLIPPHSSSFLPAKMAAKGENTNIEIFLRIKPVKRPSDRVVVDTSENKLEFVIPRDEAQGYINNQREHYEFRFNGILTQEAKQDEVRAPACMPGFVWRMHACMHHATAEHSASSRALPASGV